MKEDVLNPSQAKTKREILKTLFWSTLILSAVTFGGGYVIVSLMKKKFVDELGWIDEAEMLDLIAIAQASPGAIAVNGTIVIGYKLAGLVGILVAVVATIIPPFIIISLIAIFYQSFRENIWVSLMLEGMQAGVGAVIVSVVFTMGRQVVASRDFISIVVMIAAFVLNYYFKVNVVMIILATILIGLVQFLVSRRKGGREER